MKKQKLDPTLEKNFGSVVAGIDEAGRGPWAGPVVAAAVILPSNYRIDYIMDSKTLKKERREQLFDVLMRDADIGIGMCEPEEIDNLNILQATLRAMERACALLQGQPEAVLVDGNKAPSLPYLTHTIIAGDRIYRSIAAASIIAKVTRDRIMEAYASTYREYGFEKHSGYGTKEHQLALQRYGICPIHRKSFAPIKAFIEESV